MIYGRSMLVGVLAAMAAAAAEPVTRKRLRRPKPPKIKYKYHPQQKGRGGKRYLIKGCR